MGYIPPTPTKGDVGALEGALVVRIRDIFILNKIWVQDKIYVL
jgi:hypothetical protein